MHAGVEHLPNFHFALDDWKTIMSVCNNKATATANMNRRQARTTQVPWRVLAEHTAKTTITAQSKDWNFSNQHQHTATLGVPGVHHDPNLMQTAGLKCRAAQVKLKIDQHTDLVGQRATTSFSKNPRKPTGRCQDTKKATDPPSLAHRKRDCLCTGTVLLQIPQNLIKT